MAQTYRGPLMSLVLIQEHCTTPYYGHKGKPSRPLFSGAQPRLESTGNSGKQCVCSFRQVRGSDGGLCRCFVLPEAAHRQTLMYR